MRHTILAVLGGLTGAALADEEGVIAGVLAALLAATAIGLTHRVPQLERALSALKSTAGQPNDISLSPLPEALSPTDRRNSASTLAPTPASTRVAPELGGEHELEFDIDFEADAGVPERYEAHHVQSQPAPSRMQRRTANHQRYHAHRHRSPDWDTLLKTSSLAATLSFEQV